MRGHRHQGLIALAVIAGLALCLPGFAQQSPDTPQEDGAAEAEAEADSGTEADDTVEEIIVVAPRPGARRDVPTEFEDPLRARLLRELYLSRQDQAELARMAAEAEKNEGRVRFGYDPNRDRRDLADEMDTPQRETTRPATIFTIEF